tara:strand:+ start:78 stop:269 length:192 start_codon:yes stop_codon:yes gene_type:complete
LSFRGVYQGDTSVWPLYGLLMTFKKQVYGKVWVKIQAHREAYRRLRANQIIKPWHNWDLRLKR